MTIAARHRRENGVGPARERRDQGGFCRIVDGDVEQQHGAAHGALAHQPRRRVQQIGAIGGRDIRERVIETRQKIGEIGADRHRRSQCVGPDAG